MLKTLAIIIAVLILSFFLSRRKQSQRRELLAVFQDYNEDHDLNKIITWIKARNPAARLLAVLEYLYTIEETVLGIEVLNQWELDPFPDRALRVVSIKILRMERHENALKLARTLLEEVNDDSVLEIYIDTCLLFERFEDAERVLVERRASKVKGTSFERQWAQVLAAKGQLDEALEIMDKVVRRDYMLYKNTLAPNQKRLIYEQYVASQEIMDHMKGLSPN